MKHLKLFENYHNDKKSNLSKEETLNVAKKISKKLSKEENKTFTVNMETLESDSFDLDMEDDEFGGGSYNIYDNGNVVNVALPEKPVYYNYIEDKFYI
ncbi:MAG: hypothetical protein ACOC3V_04005 [bacterium]